MTKESRQRHRDILIAELRSIGFREEQLIEDDSISTSMAEKDQWQWFDSLLRIIQNYELLPVADPVY